MAGSRTAGRQTWSWRGLQIARWWEERNLGTAWPSGTSKLTLGDTLPPVRLHFLIPAVPYPEDQALKTRVQEATLTQPSHLPSSQSLAGSILTFSPIWFLLYLQPKMCYPSMSSVSCLRSSAWGILVMKAGSEAGKADRQWRFTFSFV